MYTGNNIFGKSGVTVKLKTSNSKAAKHFINVYCAEIALSKDSLQFNDTKVSQFTAYLALCTVYSLSLHEDTLSSLIHSKNLVNSKLINLTFCIPSQPSDMHINMLRYLLSLELYGPTGSTVTYIKIISTFKGIVIMHAILIASSCYSHGLYILYCNKVTAVHCIYCFLYNDSYLF